MLNPLKIHAAKLAASKIPDLHEQLRIVAALLKMKHFDGIWCERGKLTVRRFRDHFEEPRALSWEEARRMTDVAAGLPEAKPVQFEKTLRFRKAAGG
jgi:hypothetical protein